MPAIITPERPDTADAMALVEELELHLASFYPRESRHGYSVEKLIREGVAFFLIRDDGRPAGCGGVQLYGIDYGELKRMYVRPQFRGLGFGKLMLDHLAEYARSRSVRLLRLETGIHQHAAIALYERYGFLSIGPFGEYKEDPLSRFYELRIDRDDLSAEAIAEVARQGGALDFLSDPGEDIYSASDGEHV